jgi:hypothetical protein
MLRASLGAASAGLATRGCLYHSVGKSTSPWFRAVELRLRAAAHGCLKLLTASRSCSQLVAGSSRPGPESLGRMSASPVPCSALRGHARGRDLLRVAGISALPGLMRALVSINKCATQKTADSGTSSRRRRDEVPASPTMALTARRRRLGIATLALRYYCAGSSALTTF